MDSWIQVVETAGQFVSMSDVAPLGTCAFVGELTSVATQPRWLHSWLGSKQDRLRPRDAGFRPNEGPAGLLDDLRNVFLESGNVFLTPGIAFPKSGSAFLKPGIAFLKSGSAFLKSWNVFPESRSAVGE